MNFPNPAIVIELGVNGLSVVRSLGRLGIEVVGIYTEEDVGCFSRYCRPVKFPKIAVDEEGFKAGLIDLCSSFSAPPVLFPTNDQSVGFISRHRELLSAHALFSLPDLETLDRIINKDGTFELASRCGVLTPATFTPRTIEKIRRISGEIRFPVIFKPNDTFSGLLPGNVKNATFGNPQEMLGFFEANPGCCDKGVLQEIIRGGDGYIYVCAGYFNRRGDPLALYTGRKIRQYLPDFGITSCGESVYVPELETIVVGLMKKLGYWGLAAVEFARDRQTGEFYFLEINARSVFYNALLTSCGIDLGQVAYVDIVSGGGAEVARRRQKEGIIWIDFRHDAGSFWRKFKQGELGVFRWAATAAKARSFGVYAPDDRRPFWYSTRKLWQVFVRKMAGI